MYILNALFWDSEKWFAHYNDLLQTDNKQS